MTLLPTLNRIEKLKKFLASAIAAETSTPGILIVDKEDYAVNAEGYASLILPDQWRVELTNSVGMGDKVREVWPLVKDCAWVNLLNDDHYIVTKEWDKKLLKQLNGKNFITCNDGWNAPARAAGATIWSMPLLECVGWPIFPSQINHLGIDDVWEQIGRATGTWRVDMRVLIDHQHVYKNSQADDTHKLTYGSNLNWNGSPQQQDVAHRLEMFRVNEFGPAVEKIKKFSGVDNYFIRMNPQGAQLHK